jgi:hypothetical protein
VDEWKEVLQGSLRKGSGIRVVKYDTTETNYQRGIIKYIWHNTCPIQLPPQAHKRVYPKVSGLSQMKYMPTFVITR